MWGLGRSSSLLAGDDGDTGSVGEVGELCVASELFCVAVRTGTMGKELVWMSFEMRSWLACVRTTTWPWGRVWPLKIGEMVAPLTDFIIDVTKSAA